MNYSLNLLTSTSDCDVVITKTEEEVSNLEFKKLVLERKKKSYSQRLAKVQTELLETQAELDTISSLIGSLEGQLKQQYESRKALLEVEKVRLEQRLVKLGPTALLVLEAEAELVQRQLDELNAFHSQVATHKGTL
ncbi:hypothetical protein AAG747_27785 [Rapidithrix thailandica]|uniref:Uncharacterized protein n=1 Tax=Rapidithrix thailandica TaxID=413964 RepID=A0AAW9SHI0_9BACT